MVTTHIDFPRMVADQETETSDGEEFMTLLIGGLFSVLGVRDKAFIRRVYMVNSCFT